jgi:hypothetical protein
LRSRPKKFHPQRVSLPVHLEFLLSATPLMVRTYTERRASLRRCLQAKLANGLKHPVAMTFGVFDVLAPHHHNTSKMAVNFIVVTGQQNAVVSPHERPFNLRIS